MLERVGGQDNAAALGEKKSAVSPLSQSEEDLIARAVAGDEVAFTRLYDAHHDRVFRYIRYRVRRVEDAEDLTQKVFLQAWRALPRYRRTGSPFIAWLATIAHNETMSFFRSHRPEESLDMDPSADEEGDGLATPALDEDQEMIRDSLVHLGSDQQQVITMRFIEGFEYAEIAAALGKSEGNVRVIQHRALQQLRKLLEGGRADGKA